MSIVRREFTETDHNLKAAFFPVVLCDLKYEYPVVDLFGNVVEKKVFPAAGFKAVVDVERNNVFAAVTDQYQLVTNEMAYRWAEPVVKAVFNQTTLNDLSCFNVRMTKHRSCCYIDLIRRLPQGFRMFNPFGDDDPWTAFLRISNSYNKTVCLRYELGFCRWICKNGLIFGKMSVNRKFPHTKADLDEEKIEQALLVDAQENIGQIRNREVEFIKKLQALRQYPLPASSMLALMCKVFNIRMTKRSVEEMTTDRRKTAARLAKLINELTSSYFGQFGDNAYAALNVISDYASFPDGDRGASVVMDYQSRAGNWVDSFVEASKSPDFSMTAYLGSDAVESAYWLASMAVA